MRKLILFFLLFLSIMAMNVVAQEKKVSVTANNTSLTQVLKEIQESTPYTILYSNDVVTDTIRVTIDANRKPVSEILRSILEPNNLFYSFQNKDLIVIGRRQIRSLNPGKQFTDTLSGIVVGDNHLPVPFATISLLKNGKLLTDRVCSEQGIFSFGFDMQANTPYELKVSSVGYQSKQIGFLYPDTSTIKRIELVRLANSLAKVTVQASKPLIERKIDRLVFNLENSIAAQGTDLMEALRLTPMLKVTDNNISIIGKGGVAVMINERMIHLNGPSLISYLKSLRSDDIERIEVITTPPARYEAQGNGGLVNIVLKKNQSIGWSGNVSASYIQKTYDSYNLNGNLNYQSRRLAASLKLRDYFGMAIIKEDNNMLSDRPILTRSTRHTTTTSPGANLAINYKLSGKADIGFIYDKGKSTYKTSLQLASTYQSHDLTDSILHTNSKNNNPTNTQTLSFYYDQKLDTTGKKMSTAINIFYNTPETNNQFVTTSSVAPDINKIKTYSLVKFRIWSAQTDFTLPYKWATIESGVKFNHFSNGADVRYYQFQQQEYLIDPSKSNLFQYTEKIAAGYLSAVKQISKQWVAKAGLRYEHVNTQGYSPTTFIKNRTSYGKLFPTIYFSYKPDTKHSFALNYSRRIDRPYLRMVNPFRFYINPYFYFTGNPLLEPAISHNLEFSFLWKSNFSLTVYGSRINNGFGDMSNIENGFIISSPKNYLTQHSGGIITTLNIKIFPWWENSSFASFNFSNSKSSIPHVVVKPGSGFNYSINNSFRISKIFSSYLNFSQSLPSTQGYLYTLSQYNLSGGFRARLMENKLQLSLALQKGSLVTYQISYKDFNHYIHTDYDYRTLTLTANYSFGKNKVKGNSKNINFGEKQRAN